MVAISESKAILHSPQTTKSIYIGRITESESE